MCVCSPGVSVGGAPPFLVNDAPTQMKSRDSVPVDPTRACVQMPSPDTSTRTVSHTPLLQDNIHQCGMAGGSCVACVACGGSSAWMDILCNMDAAHNPPDSV